MTIMAIEMYFVLLGIKQYFARGYVHTSAVSNQLCEVDPFKLIIKYRLKFNICI